MEVIVRKFIQISPLRAAGAEHITDSWRRFGQDKSSTSALRPALRSTCRLIRTFDLPYEESAELRTAAITYFDCTALQCAVNGMYPSHSYYSNQSIKRCHLYCVLVEE